MALIQPMQFLAKRMAKFALVSAVLMSGLWTSLAHAEYGLNFQEPVTAIAREIYDLHMLIFYICVVIFVVVFAFMFYSIFAHRKSKNYKPATFSHSTSVEIVWTIIPFFVLVAMAWPATKTLIKMEDTTKSDLTIKITGYQWKWGYEYMGTDVSFYSTLATPRNQIDQFKEDAQPQGENYLLEVDNHLVVPSGRKVRALITANDVIHAWWIPAFGVKKDAIPGYINELWFNVEEGKEGIYRGQCAELCGKDHAFMPIVVDVVTGEQFDNWIASGGKSYETSAQTITEPVVIESTAVVESDVAADSEVVVEPAVVAAPEVAEADMSHGSKTWTKDELLAQGEKVFTGTCAACHGVDGLGMPGVFPAIKGSAVATGDVAAHISMVMFGSKVNPAMAAYASQLSDEQIAAVITYQRNAFGNNTGDVVLPADIKAQRR